MRSATVNSNWSRLNWCWLLPVLLLATLLAAQGLNADVIWFDELSTIGLSGGLTGPFTAVEILNDVKTHAPKHGPLFFELLAGWGALVGWHHAALRILTLYFGLIMIAWVFRIGRDFVDWQTGFWAALYLGTTVFWLEYFHDIKMYTLQMALLAASVWLTLFLVQSPDKASRLHWLGLISAVALSLYTQPFSILLHLAIGFYHLWFVPKNQNWIKVALGFIVAGALYLPWLPVTLHGLNTKFDTYGAMEWDQALEVFLRLITNGNWIVVALPFAAALWRLRQYKQREKLKPFWVLATIILMLLLIVNEAIGLIPIRRARYFFVAWGMWSLVIGSGLAWFSRWTVPAILMLVFLVSGFGLRSAEDYASYQGTISAVQSYPPMHEYVAALQDIVAPQDFVVGFTEGNFVNRKGKHGKSTADYYMEVLLGNDGAFVPTTFSAERLETDVPDKLDNHPYLLFIYDPQGKPDVFTLTETIIQRDYMFCSVALDRPRLRAERYVYRALTCEREYRPIEFDKGISIVDRFIEVHPERQMVRAVTGWEVDDVALLYQYNVSIQIVDTNGEKVAQIDPDRHLYDNILKWYVAELSTSGLLPGDYRVVVIVYDRESGAKISGADLANGKVAKILPIGEFEVEE